MWRRACTRCRSCSGRPLTIENVSSYVRYGHAEMTEWEFLTELTRRTGCQLLFDVNNVFVGAFNHGYDPLEFIHGVPKEPVVQFHLAGHSDMGTYIIDTHDHPIRTEVWELYRAAVARFGPVSTMIERDDNIPPLHELLAELDEARAHRGGCLGNERGAHAMRGGVMTLAEVQDSFQQALLADGDGILTQLADGPREPKEVQLGLYRDSYILRLIEFAQKDHELLSAYLGDDEFEHLARGYAAAYPSRYRNAKDFCAHLPRYLAEAEPYREHPAIAELAALEKGAERCVLRQGPNGDLRGAIGRLRARRLGFPALHAACIRAAPKLPHQCGGHLERSEARLRAACRRGERCAPDSGLAPGCAQVPGAVRRGGHALGRGGERRPLWRAVRDGGGL